MVVTPPGSNGYANPFDLPSQQLRENTLEQNQTLILAKKDKVFTTAKVKETYNGKSKNGKIN